MMPKNKKCFKYILIIVIALVLFINFDYNSFAAINETYDSSTGVIEADLDKKIGSSIVTDLIGGFIYSIASLIEWLVGSMFSMFTGENIFPWADRVIFNTLEFLDINFLNPSNGSLFESGSQETFLASIVRNTYFTIFVISISLLGVLVGVMAIKLAISSIASEKAKYKEAIKNWVLAIIMLFTVHYLISFVFFVNEKIVEVASSILTKTLVENNVTLNSLGVSDEQKKTIIRNFDTAEGASYEQSNKDDFLLGEAFYKEPKLSITYFLLNNSWYVENVLENANTVGGTDDITVSTYLVGQNGFEVGDFIKFPINYFDTLFESIDRSLGTNSSTTVIQESVNLIHNVWSDAGGDESSFDSEAYYNKIASQLLGNIGTSKIATINKHKKEVDPANLVHFIRLNYALENSEAFADQKIPDVEKVACWIVEKVLKGELEFEGDLDKDYRKVQELLGTHPGYNAMMTASLTVTAISGFEKDNNGYLDRLIKTYVAALQYKKNGGTTTSGDIISNMGQYFKTISWTVSTNGEGELTGWYPNKASIQGALLYAIFVIQSLMFFIAYIKRFFYVIILAIMAPFIVIYDFLGKTLA